MPRLNSSRNFKFRRPKDIENRARNGQVGHFTVVRLPGEVPRPQRLVLPRVQRLVLW